MDKELMRAVNNEIISLFAWMGFDDVSTIQDSILKEVCEDVMETSDYPNYNDSDIRIAIGRAITKLVMNNN